MRIASPLSVSSLRPMLALRIALRDLRGGLAGFGIFIACIALGVAAITGVGSVAHSLSDGLARQGGAVLGGDASFDLIQREASPEERAYLAAHGRVSRVGTLRAIARTPDASGLVEVKAVGADYPSAGTVTLDPPGPIDAALATSGGGYGMVADAALAARLNIKVGDSVSIGDARLVLKATLVSEPDKLAAGIGFGPRVILSDEALAATGLVVPGSLVRWLYRVTLPQAAPGIPAGAPALRHFVDDAKAAFPQAGWDVRTRENVSPQFSRNLRQLTQFLTLVGLTALIIGGVGVANAVHAFVDRKRADLATLKALGATGGRVFVLLLTEVKLIALLATLIGLAVGALVPFAVAGLFAPFLPFPLAPAVYPGELAAGFVYGLLTALVFSLAPLGRAHDVAVSALFRAGVEPDGGRLRLRYRLATAGAALLLAGTLLAVSTDRKLAAFYMLATLGAFALLRGVALLVMAGARRLPHSRRVAVRLAVANIHRPGALTPSVVLSLGLGLALLVSLTLIDGNIRRQLHQTLPGETPSFFFIDIQSTQAPAFEAFLHAQARDARLDLVPMMRGRIVAVKDRPVSEIKPKDGAAWALQGDRGITYAADVPAGSTIESGQWWAPDYKGPPLVSMESVVADGLGLKPGDAITVNVLGRDLTAHLANTREVNWRSFGLNFVLVFSPHAFDGAPHSDLATLTFPGGADTPREMGLLRAVVQQFPAVTSVRVRDVLDAVNDVVGQLATAVRTASGVALLASVLVLAGALAAGGRARLYDAVVLKTLGATRRRLLAALLVEYGLLGLCTAVFGVIAGGLAAYLVVARVMGLTFVWLWPQAIGAAAVALVATVVLGLAGTWRILGRRPAPYLRSL